MSELSMTSIEAMNARERALAYLEMQQHQKGFTKKAAKEVHSPHPIVDVLTAKTPRKEPITDTVTAYEEMIDRFGEKGYVDLAQKMERFRPDAYKGMRAFQWTAKAADIAVTAVILFPGLLRGWAPRGHDIRNIFAAVPPGGGSHWNPLDYSPRNMLYKGAGLAAMWRFRPIEWAGGKLARLGARVITSKAVAPIVNNIFGGGERVEPAKAKPAPFSGAKPQVA